MNTTNWREVIERAADTLQDLGAPLNAEELRRLATPADVGAQGEDGECAKCGAPTDPECGHVGACAAPAAGKGVDDAWYTDESTGSHCVDWDADPSRQLSIMLKRDGSVSFAAFVNGERFNGDAMSTDFMRALAALTRQPVAGDGISDAPRARRPGEWRPGLKCCGEDGMYGCCGNYIEADK